MIIVSDTSPISNFFFIGQLDMLRQLYERIIIPEAVMNELLELEKRKIDLSVIKKSGWIEVRTVQDNNEVQSILSTVDIGEAEAIVLATELGADWILIDETKGREIAKKRGLKMIGLLGVLILAKEKGLIPDVKTQLDALITKAKFWISDELYQRVLALSNE